MEQSDKSEDVSLEKPEATTGSSQAAAPNGRQRRSNRPYPPGSLEDAVKFCRELYEFNSGLAVRKLSFFDHVGRSPESSASRESITNAYKYGLLKSGWRVEQLELTNEALSIVSESANQIESSRVKVKVGIENIQPFRIVFEKIVGNRLPAKTALVDQMREADVPGDLLDEAVDLFIVNLRYAKLLQILSGAERVIPVSHLLDTLSGEVTSPSADPTPEIGKVALQAREYTAAALHKIDSETADLSRTCFYITPIGATGSEARKHSDLYLGSIVEPAVSSLGLEVVRADTIGQPGIITKQILEYILKSRLVIADLSFHNPNVFYELALRHAARLPIVQIVRQRDSIPFDINQMRTIQIDDSDIYSFVPKLEIFRAEIATQARRALEDGHEVTTPISIYFPSLKTTLS